MILIGDITDLQLIEVIIMTILTIYIFWASQDCIKQTMSDWLSWLRVSLQHTNHQPLTTHLTGLRQDTGAPQNLGTKDHSNGRCLRCWLCKTPAFPSPQSKVLVVWPVLLATPLGIVTLQSMPLLVQLEAVLVLP